MGEFYWDIGVWSADQERMETVSALVGTRASYSVFSRPMLERLGIRRLERVEFERADGSIVELDVGVAWLTIDGRNTACSVIFGDDDAEPLIGANALQEFLLRIDPVAERLIPRTGRIKTLA